MMKYQEITPMSLISIRSNNISVTDIYSSQMRFISLDKVNTVVEPNKHITLVLKMLAMESNMHVNSLPLELSAYNGTDATNILYIYTILKSIDSRSKWRIGTATFTSGYDSMDIWYLYNNGNDNTLLNGSLIKEETIISILSDEVAMSGSLEMDDKAICVGSDLYKYTLEYRYNNLTLELPSTSSELSRWLRSENLLDDSNASQWNTLLTQCLKPGSNFDELIINSDILNGKTRTVDLYHQILIRSIKKIKLVKGTNYILGVYPPNGC